MFFTVTLSSALNVEVRVNYFPSNGTAIADLDYFASAGTLVFSPGQTKLRIPVSFRNDTVVEPDETFFMNLSSPFNASISRSRGTATIVNDDTVGTMELDPYESSAVDDEMFQLALRWVHPVRWRDLDTIDLRILDDDGVVIWIRFAEAENTFALCTAEDDCLEGAPPGVLDVMQAPDAALHLANSAVNGSGATGPSVELVYGLSLGKTLRGTELLVEAAATTDSGDAQSFAQVGTVTVGDLRASGSNNGCAIVPPGEADGGSVSTPMLLWMLLATVLRRRRWTRCVIRFHGDAPDLDRVKIATRRRQRLASSR